MYNFFIMNKHFDDFLFHFFIVWCTVANDCRISDQICLRSLSVKGTSTKGNGCPPPFFEWHVLFLLWPFSFPLMPAKGDQYPRKAMGWVVEMVSGSKAQTRCYIAIVNGMSFYCCSLCVKRCRYEKRINLTGEKTLVPKLVTLIYRCGIIGFFLFREISQKICVWGNEKCPNHSINIDLTLSSVWIFTQTFFLHTQIVIVSSCILVLVCSLKAI